ncbi:MAG: DMT family transporter [Sphaerochaetaceae bacterium]|jgi:drug/metabolite transporter (DMT)-like permease
MKLKQNIAHALALITVTIWGTTFIATKLLLSGFSPVEILLIRFLMAYVGLSVYTIATGSRKRAPFDLRHELLCGAAGLTGVVMYYYLENVALTMTNASNVGILVSMAPLSTALLGIFLLKEEKVRPAIFVGFFIASVGAVLVMFNGIVEFDVQIKGDLLAISATLGWALYSIILRKIDSTTYKVAHYTRKIFFYGIVFMLPFFLSQPRTMTLHSFTLTNTLLLIFLGLGASAACFVSWNYAVKVLGVYKTSAYIYLSPLASLVTAALVLSERMTLMGVGGCLLILGGLYVSEKRPSKNGSSSQAA